GEPIVVHYSPRDPNISAVDVGRLDRVAAGMIRLTWLFGAAGILAGLFQIRGYRIRRRSAATV
ncbi:MAG TPA: hypothetical protein VFV47_02735, partial [Hyphomicrobiaceae bacterium]|nr:hypothetical protein [Hyphomicrobiaceae bacterium]